MKRLLLIVPVVLLLASCKNNASDDTKVLGATSAEEYAEFKAWKAQKEAEAAKPKEVRTVVYRTAPASSVSTRRKGWSKAAKGAVIGGAVGAIGGAVIAKKNPAAGAVIGAVVGAGAGSGIGRSMDKKDGRY